MLEEDEEDDNPEVSLEDDSAGESGDFDLDIDVEVHIELEDDDDIASM